MVRVVGSIASLKVARRGDPDGHPGRAAGRRRRGHRRRGRVGRRAAATAGELGVGPVAVVVVDPVAAVGDDELEGRPAGDVDGERSGSRSSRSSTPESDELGPVDEDLEDDRAVARRSRRRPRPWRVNERAAAVHRVADVGRGVDAEALGVDDPLRVSGLPSPAACSPLLRSFSTGPQPLATVVKARSDR